jgi:hypothetical protein
MGRIWVYIGDLLARMLNVGRVTFTSELGIRKFDKDGKLVEDRGVVSRKVVTTAFVNLLVDALQSTTGLNFDQFKYHDCGTGTGNEAVGDTGLGTPCGEAREVGTQAEGATANIYKSVATHTFAGAFAITEHGLFNASSVGTLMDRSKFAAVNMGIGEKIEFTYQLTCTAGG